MTNTSIKNAFTQFWYHVILKDNETLISAKEYTDEKILYGTELPPTGTEGQIFLKIEETE